MIPVGISNRHIHLNEADKNLLFGNEYKLEVRRNLKQVGQFSSESVVSLKTDKGIIENVRVIGPIRNYTQVELLKSDELINKDEELENEDEECCCGDCSCCEHHDEEFGEEDDDDDDEDDEDDEE